mgnify:CR=1 FL=1
MPSELDQYKAALDAHSIVAITDSAGLISYVNDKFCEISRFSRDELIGQDHRIINSGFHSKEFIRNIWVTIANGNVWKARSQAAYQGYSHLSGIEMMSSQYMCDHALFFFA